MGGLTIALSAGIASAQTTPLTITGFNADVIADGASVTTSTTGTIDGTDVFYDSSYAASYSGSTLGAGIAAGAFPASQSITNQTTGVIYDLPSATPTVNNGLLVNSTAPVTLTLDDAGSLGTLYLLGTSAGGPLLDYTLTFAGGIVTGPATFSFADWYDLTATGFVNGLGRVGAAFPSVNNYDNVGGNNFSLYSVAIPIPVADQSLTLQSIAISLDSSDTGGSAVVFAASTSPVPEPTALLLGAAGVGLLAILRRRS
jgi:hypothetical protein